MSREHTLLERIEDSRKFPFAALAIVALMAMVAFFAVVENGFVMMDEVQVLGHSAPMVDSIGDQPDIEGFALPQSNPVGFAPVTRLFFRAERAVFHQTPRWYHLTSLLLHSLVAVLFCALVGRVFSDSALALIAGLLFAVYPLATQSIAFISAQGTLLSQLFAILALHVLLSAFRRCGNATVLIMLSVTLTALSLLSGQQGWTVLLLTLAVAALELRYEPRRALVTLAGVCVVTAAWVTLMRHTQWQADAPFGVVATLAENPAALAPMDILSRIWWFFRLLLWPVGLLPLYEISRAGGSDGMTLMHIAGTLAAVIGLMALSVRAFSQRPSGFASLWILCALLPFVVMMSLGEFSLSDASLYGAICGLALLAAAALKGLAHEFERPAVAVIVILVALLSVGSGMRSGVWENSVTLWRDALRTAADNPAVQYQLGRAYLAREDSLRALETMNRTLELDPAHLGAHASAGVLQELAGQLPLAVEHYESVLELDPDSTYARLRLGDVFRRSDQLEEARVEYEQVLDLDPDSARAHYGMAWVLGASEDADVRKGALPHALRAIELRPDFSDAHYLTGLLFFEQADLQNAVSHLEITVEQAPAHFKARDLLEQIRLRQGGTGR